MKITLSYGKGVIVSLFILINCGISFPQTAFKVNKSHLDYLCREIEIGGKKMAVVNIYCNAPDYKYVGDDDEGYACVDDAARAAIFYLEYYKAYNDPSSLAKYYKLVEFLLYMQADNGFFYNFLYDDNSINRTFRTSVAEPGWWSWRALWALIENSKITSVQDEGISLRINAAVKKTIDALKQLIPAEKNEIEIDGVKLPDWLPSQTASDQSALLVIVLSEYYGISGDKEILNYLNSVMQGIMMMQINDPESEYNGAFLSWQNTWHGWGNSQSYALLRASRILNDDELKKSALLELNNFYNVLIKNGFLSYFKVEKKDCRYEEVESNKFPQIAYTIRPVVYALIEAYNITSDPAYARKAGEAAKWFTGGNPVNAKMYNGETGIIFDGIENDELINKNSGAESTIEGLMTLLKVSRTPAALKEFEK